MDYDLLERTWDKAHRTEAETGRIIPDCRFPNNKGLNCKMPVNHTGPHVSEGDLWFSDQCGKVFTPEEWYEDHPS